MKLDKHPEAEALIFDLDGTLSDSLPVHIETWHRVCSHYHCEFDPAILPELTGMPTIQFAYRIIADQKLQGVDAEEMVKMKQRMFWENVELIRPNLPVVGLVHRYHGKMPLSVGTGASRRSAEMQLKALKIFDLFDAVVSADDVTEHKPEPQTFLRCAELMKVDPAKCQVFEDGVLGMQAAQKAGMLLTDVRPYLADYIQV